MASLQDIHFAAALAVVRAKMLAQPNHMEGGHIEALQEEVERLRLENIQLKEQIEAMVESSSANHPESILINLKDPAVINTIKQIDIIRSYSERCRHDEPDSGLAFIDITCDVISALTDSSIRQNRDDVAYAADWIGEGLEIESGKGADVPQDWMKRVANALMSMISTFRTIDCFSESFESSRANIWTQENNPTYADIREQMMQFLVQLGKRSIIDGFILSGLCSELLAIFIIVKEETHSEQWNRYSQNASYLCRTIDCILQYGANRCEGDIRKVTWILYQLLQQSEMRLWVEIWPDILTASVSVGDKLPLVATFAWQLARFIEGGCGTAWKAALLEFKTINSLF